MASGSYRFGEFELNVPRYELRRGDALVKLERIPMDLLILLAERNGEVVTRPEIVERLWGKDIYVDTEHGINTAVRKIRAALKEDAERPRCVFTVPGKGYRLAIEELPPIADTVQRTIAPAALEPPVVATPPPRQSHTIAVAAAIVGTIAATLLIGRFVIRDKQLVASQAGPIRSIAVLPLANLSNDRSQDYFADGITDELITMLAKKTSIRVISRTSAMQYKGVKRPIADIARELGVDSVLEGSITMAESRVHVTLQLIHAASDTHVWADSFDRSRDDAYALPGTAAEAISKAIGAPTKARAERRIDPFAHDAYLHGRYFWFVDDYDRAQECMEKAIEAQADYAAAWSGLADSLAARAVGNLVRPRDAMTRAHEANKRALELDPTLAEAHNTLGALSLFYDWDFAKADAESRKAIELNPNLSEPHHLRSYVMAATNRPDEAVAEQRRSTELDPFARPWALGFVMLRARQYDAALTDLQLRNQAQPHDRFVRLFLAEAYERTGHEKEAVAELAEAYRLFGAHKLAADILKAFASGGTKAVDEYQLQDLLARSRTSYVSPLSLANDYARLGDREKTLAALEAATRERSPFLIFLQSDPRFDFLHGDSRYDAIVKTIGLPTDSTSRNVSTPD